MLEDINDMKQPFLMISIQIEDQEEKLLKIYDKDNYSQVITDFVEKQNLKQKAQKKICQKSIDFARDVFHKQIFFKKYKKLSQTKIRSHSFAQKRIFAKQISLKKNKRDNNRSKSVLEQDYNHKAIRVSTPKFEEIYSNPFSKVTSQRQKFKKEQNQLKSGLESENFQSSKRKESSQSLGSSSKKSNSASKKTLKNTYVRKSLVPKLKQFKYKPQKVKKQANPLKTLKAKKIQIVRKKNDDRKNIRVKEKLTLQKKKSFQKNQKKQLYTFRKQEQKIDLFEIFQKLDKKQQSYLDKNNMNLNSLNKQELEKVDQIFMKLFMKQESQKIYFKQFKNFFEEINQN